MLAATVFGFAGYALLLPVVPLWAARGGSGELGAGATTGVLMLATVATQLGVPWLLARWGYRFVLGAGMVLLGAPTPLFALSTDLVAVLAISAVRGVGFGMLTVAGSALVAELVPRAEHGRAAARYGFAVGAPQLVLLPAGVAVAERLGFTVVFAVAGAAPLLGALLVPLIRAERHDRPGAEPVAPAVAVAGEPGAGLRRHAVGPVLAMLTCSTAQGGLITFLPLAVANPGLLVPLALLATGSGALLGRWLAGELVDRRGMGGRLLVPGMLLAAAGMLAELLAVGGAGAPAATALVGGAAAVGVGFGVVQNDSLVALFTAGGAQRYGTASAIWNIAYDAGTGAGAVGLGAVAEPYGFRTAFGTAALLLVLAVPAARPRRG
ncbi:MFS transporter [Pseudonocardia sp. H11422]|uniref:MFS transporter n=1 Tax=Pseudonocardia sp. H11422 TaxID=2835866 RepID=UPI001BDC3020|nr:MFS transporter [Pseudonocardia sp. H11422]